MRLSEKFEKLGYFWIASKRDDRLPGTLRISESGETKLELFGTFGGEIPDCDAQEEIVRINGQLEGGSVVTLDKCFHAGRSFDSGGISQSTLHVHTVFVGVLYDRDEEIEFTSFRFSVEGLDEWLAISGIEIEHKSEPRGVSINYRIPKAIPMKLGKDIDATFIFSSTYPGAPNFTGAGIKQKAFIKLTSKKLLPIDEFRRMAGKLNNFMCFAMDKTVSIDSIVAFSPNIKRDFGDGKEYEEAIDVYYPSLPVAEKKPVIHWHTMFFRYKQVSERLRNVLLKWLEAYEQIEPAFNLYFASKSGAYQYIEGRFLSLAQGIETFHRRTSDEKIMPEREFEVIVNEVIEACPKERRKWLRERVTYANELSLRMRLKQMVEPFTEYFEATGKVSVFVGRIVDTRNYLTHYDKRLKSKVCSGDRLWEITMKLECLFQLHILRISGFSDEEIRGIVEGNREFNWKLNNSNDGKGSEG